MTAAPALTFSSHSFVSKSLAIYPLVCILLAKFGRYRGSLAECFFAALQELSPQQAERLAGREPLQRKRRGLRDKVAVRAAATVPLGAVARLLLPPADQTLTE